MPLAQMTLASRTCEYDDVATFHFKPADGFDGPCVAESIRPSSKQARLWPDARGLMTVAFGVCRVSCVVWRVANGVWVVACGVWPVGCGLWRATCA